ncbi:MAG: hypothetical protein C0524_03110 [Rhodobacter sp.]|nr:hypothetical protein [Rhodobacter sp.]
MMSGSSFVLVCGQITSSMRRFRDDERGAMTLVILFVFLAMIMFGGIAIDVMRFETRRVALQQTLDRAALAAASLTQERSPTEIAQEWFDKAGLGEDLVTVDYSAPTVSAVSDAGLRRVNISARVRSYNFFMSIYSDNDYLEAPTLSEAAQGVSEIEVMLVLDITGSMGSSIGTGKTKIQALREAATEFVDIVKANDTKNGISIGLVPYAAQVNIPETLRQQFNAVNVSSWNFIDNVGVPNINCFEIPTSAYNSTALSRTTPIRMGAVADASSNMSSTTNYVAAASVQPNPTARNCTTTADVASTPYDDATANQVFLPTKDGEAVKTRISRLQAAGNTAIAIGMRWGTALIDEAARPIYTNIGDPSVLGRPADNDSIQTRKIIVLMTDGSHVVNNHVLDAYKSGPSPIWRGSDGKYAMRFWSGGFDLNDNARPTNCSGWNIPTSANREYFVPHLKRDSVKAKVKSTEPEGQGTGTSVAGACDPLAWKTSPSWPLLNAAGAPVLDAAGAPIIVNATRLDWSEVWRYLTVNYVSRQLYMRSGVSGATNNTTNMNLMRATYLSSVSNLDALLQQNCTAARAAGVEIYGIAFAAPDAGQTQIRGCSSFPKENYYYNAADNGKLLSAFKQIATDISDLRLTQ